MDLLKWSIRKSVPNLSKISHENEILSQKGIQLNTKGVLNPHPSPPPPHPITYKVYVMGTY